MKKRVGDTLIEVTLAVGIFSMVAVAIVAVMSGGTSSAQTALETTLAREEIDTQAEALRFIQSSYIADKDSSDKRFTNLWQEIKKNAVTLSASESSEDNALLNYAPASCDELYSSTGEVQNYKAFIINPRTLGTFSGSSTDTVLISANKNPDRFARASTYPRLIYSKNNSTDDSASLIADTSTYDFYRAEGIYIIAVKDSSKTTIVADGGSSQKSAFYDFYIRTCWYGTDANRPSTISTVIRLYDPDIVDPAS